jgi:hypothetical protein
MMSNIAPLQLRSLLNRFLISSISGLRFALRRYKGNDIHFTTVVQENQCLPSWRGSARRIPSC